MLFFSIHFSHSQSWHQSFFFQFKFWFQCQHPCFMPINYLFMPFYFKCQRLHTIQDHSASWHYEEDKSVQKSSQKLALQTWGHFIASDRGQHSKAQKPQLFGWGTGTKCVFSPTVGSCASHNVYLLSNSFFPTPHLLFIMCRRSELNQW